MSGAARRAKRIKAICESKYKKNRRGQFWTCDAAWGPPLRNEPLIIGCINRRFPYIINHRSRATQKRKPALLKISWRVSTRRERERKRERRSKRRNPFLALTFHQRLFYSRQRIYCRLDGATSSENSLPLPSLLLSLSLSLQIIRDASFVKVRQSLALQINN